MRLSSDGLIDLQGSDGILCPNAYGGPINPLHAQRVQMIDIAQDATAKNEDGDAATPELEAVATALAYGSRSSNYMRLFRSTVIALDGDDRGVPVEALFFRCGVCGLVLPANRVPGRLR